MPNSFKKNLSRIPNYVLVLSSIALTVLLIETIMPFFMFGWKKIYQNFLSDNDKFYIYCVGGSTMEGCPYTGQITPGKIVSHIFDGKINGKEIELIHITKSGDDLHPQYKKLRRSLLFTPQKNAVILLYSGINEYAAYPHEKKELFNLWKFLRKSIILESVLDIITFSQSEIFEDTENTYINYLKSSSFYRYKYFLNQTTGIAKDNNIPVIISTLTCNLAGFNPLHMYENNKEFADEFKSRLHALAKDYEKNKTKTMADIDSIISDFKDFRKSHKLYKYKFINEQVYTLYYQGLNKEKSEDFDAAIAIYESILSHDLINTHNDYDHIITAAHFRIGKCMENLKRYNKALTHYKKSLPTYYGTIRPPLALNEIIKNHAKENKLLLANTEKLIIEHTPNNLPGYNMFFDAHHPNIKGQILLSYGFANQLKRLTGQKIIHKDLNEKQIMKIFDFTNPRLLNSYIASSIWLMQPFDIMNDENTSAVLSHLYTIKDLLDKILFL